MRRRARGSASCKQSSAWRTWQTPGDDPLPGAGTPRTEAFPVYHEEAVRLAAFGFLEEQTRLRGPVLHFEVLRTGFSFQGQRICIASFARGIFKPASLQWPLSIVSVPIVEGKPRPYEDEMDENGLLRYRYFRDDPSHSDNSGLRELMRSQLPLIYLHGVEEGWYRPLWPVFIVHDEPSILTFTVAVDDASVLAGDRVAESAAAEARRQYVTRLVQQRLHQESFRHRVLRAYSGKCTVCRLAHAELLDAAHILPDSHPLGEPWITNGLSLCKLHHAAFDANILGIRPDLKVEVRRDILEEIDGPMLVHGVQEFHDRPLLVLPRIRQERPNREFLEERYEMFCRAG